MTPSDFPLRHPHCAVVPLGVDHLGVELAVGMDVRRGEVRVERAFRPIGRKARSL